MTNPYRAMCAELADALAEWRLGGGPPEDTADADLIDRARALLAQPVAQPPADGEVAELVETLKGIAYWRRHGTIGGLAPAPSTSAKLIDSTAPPSCCSVSLATTQD